MRTHNSNKYENSINKIQCNNDLVLIFTVIILAALHISLIFNDSVWCDEAYTMIQCRKSFSSMMENVKVDAWPPFYGITSWLFAHIFGISVPSLKLYSIIPTLLTIILGIHYIKQIIGSTYVALTYALLVGVMPLSLHMSLEIRGYSWGMFFVTMCAFKTYQFWQKKKISNFILMLIWALLAAYTHYFAVVSVAIIFTLLFVALIIQNKKNIILCFVITLICFLAYLPWLANFLKAAGSVASGYWIPKMRFSNFMECFLFPFTKEIDSKGEIIVCEFTYIFVILGIFLVLLLFRNIFNSGMKNARNEIIAVLSLVVWGGLIVCGYLISKLISPMFIPRYMYFTIGLLWLAFSIMIFYCIKNETIRIGIIALIIFAGISGYVEQRSSSFENGTEKAKKVINAHCDNETGIFSDSDYLNWTEIKYYFPDSIHSESGGNIDVITLNGVREHFLFLATDDFSEYYNNFEMMGYSIEKLGNYNFDGIYCFELYEMKKESQGMTKILEELVSRDGVVNNLDISLNIKNIKLYGEYTGGIQNGLLQGYGKINTQANELNIKIIEGNFINGQIDGNVTIIYDNDIIEKVNISQGTLEGKSIIYETDGTFWNVEYSSNQKFGKASLMDRDGNVIKQDWYFNDQLISDCIKLALSPDIDYYYMPENHMGQYVVIDGSVEKIREENEYCILKIIDNKGDKYFVKYYNYIYNMQCSMPIIQMTEGDNVKIYGVFEGIWDNTYIWDEEDYGKSFPYIQMFYNEVQGVPNFYSMSFQTDDYKEINSIPVYYTNQLLNLKGRIDDTRIDYVQRKAYCKIITEQQQIYYLEIPFQDKFPLKGEKVIIYGNLYGNYKNKIIENGTEIISEVYPLLQVTEWRKEEA